VVYDRADWHDGPQPADAAARAESDHRGGTYRVVFNRHDITVVELQK
jgi:hypothetical protein